MTNIITRYFESTDQALSARTELVRRRLLSRRIVHLFDTAEGLAEQLTALDVSAKTAQAYQDRIAKGGAVLMIRAGYKPLGVAQITRDVTADMGAVLLEGFDEEIIVKERPKASKSILQDHPLMLTAEKDPYSTNVHMADWPIPLIIRRTPPTSVIRPYTSMTRAFFPLTMRRAPFTGSLIEPHGRMANFLLPLLSKRKPFTGSIFAPHARMADFPIPLISRRKPYSGTIIGRHTQMASVPFPHLITGKTGTNTLIPGGPRMANFPIPLLSKRTPSDKSIFPRHARMANFPISLISRRKPFTGSAFPRHARMADFILPLIIKKSGKEQLYGSKSFSLSRMLGFPTLIRR